jgi:hypothetical protein
LKKDLKDASSKLSENAANYEARILSYDSEFGKSNEKIRSMFKYL